MKYCKVKIAQPIVLHDKEEVNIDELKKELILYKELGGAGIYVYRQVVDYPYGKFKKDYTYHSVDRVLDHIKKYQYLTHRQKAVVEWNPDRGFRLD